MKKWITLFLVLSYALVLVGCIGTAEENTAGVTTESFEATGSEPENATLQFFKDKYDMTFKLWGPEGHDLYAFYIYPDYAEGECHILMPENTDDIAQYQKNLSWEVVDDELIIHGAESHEAFKIDISMETATSTITGRVYKIYEMKPSVE